MIHSTMSFLGFFSPAMPRSTAHSQIPFKYHHESRRSVLKAKVAMPWTLAANK